MVGEKNNQKIHLHTRNAPDAIGPYSQALQVGNFLVTSGQIPLDAKTGELVQGDIEEQTHQVLKNIKNILSSSDFSLSHVVKATIYLTNLEDFQKVNNVYSQYFDKPYPVRTTVQVSALPMGSSVEIDVIAILHN